MPNTVYQQVQTPDIDYSAFDLSHEVRTTGIMGDLIPCFLSEIVPGDDFQVNTRHVIRMAPMLYPLFHEVNVYFHYFFVPNRILWDDWEDFITGGEQGNSAPTFPQYDINDLDYTTRRAKLADYLGLPITTGSAENSSVKVSQLPFRAYLQIYNDYYRDQNQTNTVEFGINNVVVKKRAWEKDYFTSSLPWTQRSTSRIQIPVDIDYSDLPTFDFVGNQTGGSSIQTSFTGSTNINLKASGQQVTQIDNIDQLNMDIAELRRATAIQRWLELSARTGSRYVEHLASNFGVRNGDERLQRAEYLGGGKEKLQISEVLQTAEGTTGDVGFFAGHGISTGQKAGFRQKFTEHGYVIGIMSVLPRTGYHQGIDRHWSRTDKFDYYNPLFAHIGEQAVLNQELFFDPLDVDYNESTFGYQQRFAEYKQMKSSSHAEFRDAGGLLPWHLDRVFTSQPTLGEDFIEADPDTRIFNITDASLADHLWCYLHHNVQARRPMPYFANPSL